MTTGCDCGPGPDTIGPGKGVKKGRWESEVGMSTTSPVVNPDQTIRPNGP